MADDVASYAGPGSGDSSITMVGSVPVDNPPGYVV